MKDSTTAAPAPRSSPVTAISGRGPDAEARIRQSSKLAASQGYCDAKGVYSARKAVMQYAQQLGIAGVEIDDIYIGNGVSELVVMAFARRYGRAVACMSKGSWPGGS